MSAEVELEALRFVAEHQYVEADAGIDVATWLLSRLPAIVTALERGRELERENTRLIGEMDENISKAQREERSRDRWMDIAKNLAKLALESELSRYSRSREARRIFGDLRVAAELTLAANAYFDSAVYPDDRNENDSLRDELRRLLELHPRGGPEIIRRRNPEEWAYQQDYPLITAALGQGKEGNHE